MPTRLTRRLVGAAAATAVAALAYAGTMTPASAAGPRADCPDQFRSTEYGPPPGDVVTWCNFASYDPATNQVSGYGEISTVSGHVKVTMTGLDVSTFDDPGLPSTVVAHEDFTTPTHKGWTAPTSCQPAEWYEVTIKYSITWSDGSVQQDEYPVFYNPGDACR